MDLKAEFKRIAEEIDKEILRLLENEKTRQRMGELIIDVYLEKIIDVSRHGKRLRGAFVYFSYLMHGGKNESEILKAAAAIELLHTYALIFDDVQDKAETRRGVETISKYYSHDVNARDKIHFGNSIAIDASVTVYHIALNTLSKLNFDTELLMKCIQYFSEIFIDLSYGQTLDIFGETLLGKVSERYVMKVLYYKTANYTYQNPLFIGAILAGDESNEKDIIDYSNTAGLAFQITDDILGIYGNEEEMGKSATSDIVEGKNTLLVYKAFEKANEEQRKHLLHCLGNQNSSEQDISKFKSIIEETGSLNYAKKVCRKLVDDATVIVNRNPNWNQAGKDFLIWMAEYMINRTH